MDATPTPAMSAACRPQEGDRSTASARPGHGTARLLFPNLLIAGAWGLTILAHTEGWERLLSHDILNEGVSDPLVTAGLFFAGWLVMVGAMMLPSSLPTYRRFAQLADGGPRRHTLAVAFLGGYFRTWTVVGVVAYSGDGLLHGLVEVWPWLDTRPWLISASTFFLAGGAMIVRHAKDRPAPDRTELHPTQRQLDPSAAARLGAKHGVRRLRGCWPLMLLSFAVGMTNLLWMAGLTLAMFLEGGYGTWGRVAGLYAGIGLLVLGTVAVVETGWLPPAITAGT